MRSVLDIRIEGQATYLQVGSSIRRRFPRVKGKAAVKAAKKTRIVARESAARFSNAA